MGPMIQPGGPKAKIIDAHHIKPLSGLMRRLLKGHVFQNDAEMLEWLIQQKEIADINLDNGITLCRACHKETHKCWGSRVNP